MVLEKVFICHRISYKSNLVMSQKFDFLLAMDFEATCLRNGKMEPVTEIIEFPCLKIDTKSFKVIDEYHSYVQPKFNPILSEFCTELTGILQETVNDQPYLPNVLDNFQNWLKSGNLNSETAENFAVVTCGDWDLKTCLPKQCEAYGIESVHFFYLSFNFNRKFE
jgi:inhibitor of KinA sporulation pathway (predicted exonuclease)